MAVTFNSAKPVMDEELRILSERNPGYQFERNARGELIVMPTGTDEAKAVVRRNTEEVQGKGRFEVFEELFADDFVDHTTQPGTGMTPDKAGVRRLYMYIREAFPDFRAEIHWQLADGDRAITYKTYHGTHQGCF